jgi:hypothetical protein
MTQPVSRSSRNLSAVATLAWILASLATSNPAHGYVFNNCKYPGTNPTIEYRYLSMDVPEDAEYRFFHSSGKDKWNATTAPGSFTHTTGTDPEIDVYAAYYSWSSLAVTSGGCGTGGDWTNDKTTIQYNHNTMDIRTDNQNIRTATHELDHTYGLAHDPSVGCAETGADGYTRAVMYQNSSWVAENCIGTFSVPYTDDISGVHAIY